MAAGKRRARPRWIRLGRRGSGSGATTSSRLFGTPDETEGSVNEPRLQVEHGLEFNEKWTYDRPRHEPTRPRARVDLLAALRLRRARCGSSRTATWFRRVRPTCSSVGGRDHLSPDPLR